MPFLEGMRQSGEGGAKICAQHYGASSLYCTYWVSTSGSGYRQVTINSSTGGWASFHNCGWQYHVFVQTLTGYTNWMLEYRIFYNL